MKLSTWVGNEVSAGRGRNKTDVLRKLAQKIADSGDEVSFVTLQNVEGGKRLHRYDKARAIAKATGEQVTVEDLCES